MWLLVYQAYALARHLSQGIGHTVFNAESHMVNTLIALVQPLLDGALGTCRLQQLQLHLATLQESGLYLLVFYYFCCITLQPQHVGEERQGLLNALDCNAQMLNVRNLHVSFLFNV